MSSKQARPHLAIVADDLTGAADSAAACRGAGLRARVVVGDAWPKAQDLTPVVALSTDSRRLAAEDAAARVRAAVAQAPDKAHLIWYKKVDSTLRGNLGAELDAALDTLGRGRIAVVCPAFPAQERGVEDGFLVHSGTPARTVHLASRLREQSARKVEEVHLATVRSKSAELAAALQAAATAGAQILAVDALTHDDLEVILQAARAGLEDPLLAGSAGLAGVVAAELTAHWPAKAQGASLAPAKGEGPVLAVVGSGSRMAHAQIAAVQEKDAARVRVLDRTWSTMDLVSAGNRPAGDWLIHLPLPPSDAVLEGPSARVEAARLADLSADVVRRLQPATMIVVGGDTATYVMQALGLREMEVVEELLPGVPLLVGQDRDGRPCTLALKAGNFGDEGTLAQLYDLLKARQTSPVAV
jgi:uncharacterized protein YgbK (DUF1537 family)